MRAEAGNPRHREYRAVDKRTGKMLERVKWADTDTGKYAYYDKDLNLHERSGSFRIVVSGTGEVVAETA